MYSPLFVARFWSKVAVRKCHTDCWVWRGAKASGYGRIKVKGANRNANRVAWEIFNGKPLGDLMALHHCDNKICCNPLHIYAGTAEDNMRDREIERRAKAKDPGYMRRTNQRLSPEDRQTIWAWYQDGTRICDISRNLDIPYTTIRSMIKKIEKDQKDGKPAPSRAFPPFQRGVGV